jgi:hypothetical protein
MQIALAKPLLTIFLVKTPASDWLDIVNGTEKARLTKVLEKKRA